MFRNSCIIDKLSKQQRESLRKLDRDRLRARLVKSGAEEDLVFTSEREALLEMMTDIMLQPEPVPAAAAKSTPAEMLEMRKLEMQLKEKELSVQLEMQRQQLKAERLQRDAERSQQSAHLEAERQQRAEERQQQTTQFEAELEVRKAEIRLQKNVLMKN